MDVKGLAAIVTGGASGLGGATASALAAKGAKVAIFDRNAELGEKKAKELGGIFCNVDVGDAASAEAGVKAVVEKLGTPRVAVNCAGIGRAGRTISKTGPMPLQDFEIVLKVNLIGTFNIIRLAAAEMAKAEPLAGGERGVIVNTASVAAFEGQLGQAAYAASKGGIVAMTLPVARELARSGIRCVTIAPGIMETPMLLGMAPEVQESLGRMVPFPSRMGRPVEFAALVRHIAENSYLNGEVIRLDGAIRMGSK